jgi:hypothetical protein
MRNVLMLHPDTFRYDRLGVFSARSAFSFFKWRVTCVPSRRNLLSWVTG